jgi:nucleoside-diphosphate-sugar epimerase
MKILVTGAAGFLGQQLVRALAARSVGIPDFSSIVAADLAAGAFVDPGVDYRVGSITDRSFVRAIVEPDVGLVFHLAAVLSGQSEAEFDLGLAVNFDATRHLLECCRSLGRAPRLVFTSSIAVYGGRLPAVVPEDMALRPDLSYGAEKAMTELLILDYARRGFVSAVVCRVPTVAIRPGAPNSALSSFVSGIVREPMAGVASVCPVPLDARIWITSPAVVIQNLLHAARLPREALAGQYTVNLPGITATPREMLESLERVGGAAARALVSCTPDARITSAVMSWPGAFDVSRARELGFEQDRDVDAIVRQYAEWVAARG